MSNNRSLILDKSTNTITLEKDRQIQADSVEDLFLQTYLRLATQGAVTKGALVYEVLMSLRPEATRAASLHRYLEKEVSPFISRLSTAVTVYEEQKVA